MIFKLHYLIYLHGFFFLSFLEEILVDTNPFRLLQLFIHLFSFND